MMSRRHLIRIVFFGISWLAFLQTMQRRSLLLSSSSLGTGAAKNSNTEKEGFSACLFFKDDNERLVEWIAYHFHVLDLRYLVVGVDYNSATSPADILRRWNQTGRIQTYIWNTSDVTPVDKVDGLNNRQNHFDFACLQEMKRVNRSWVTIIDTDEYITFNRFSHGDPTLLELNFSQYATTTRDNLIRARTRLPITGGDTTAYSFIQQESDNLPWAYQSCVPMFRLQFGLRETPISQLEREDDLSLPAGHKTTDYYTTRYFQHRPKGSCNKNCKGKTMIDVSRIPDDHLIHSDYNPHGGATTSCGPHNPVPECNGTLVPDYATSIFRVHHYLESVDTVMSRNIQHGSSKMKKFNWYKGLQSEPELEASYWLKSFVANVGEKEARFLLSKP
eukprot:scaffold5037_cov180-Skeletonema_marinoi.AAC.2